MFRPRAPAVVNNVVNAASNAASTVTTTVQDTASAVTDAVSDATNNVPSVPAPPAAITGAFGHFAEDARDVVHTGVDRIGARAGHIGTTVIDRGADVVRGTIGGTADVVQGGLGRVVPKVVDFAGDTLGLGGVGGRVRDTIGAIRRPVDRGIDNVVNGVTNVGRRAGDFGRRTFGDAKGGVIDGVHDAKDAAVHTTTGAIDTARNTNPVSVIGNGIDTITGGAGGRMGSALVNGVVTTAQNLPTIINALGSEEANDASSNVDRAGRQVHQNTKAVIDLVQRDSQKERARTGDRIDDAGRHRGQIRENLGNAASTLADLREALLFDEGGGNDQASDEIQDNGGGNPAEDIIETATDAVDDAADAGRDAAEDATDAGHDAAEGAGEVFNDVTSGGGGGGGSWPF